MIMFSMSSLRYFYKAFEKPHALIYNILTHSTSKYALFHESKLLRNNFKIEIKMPSLSPTMTEGTIVKWLKKEGDPIEPGDVLCEIQTDKAVVGLETEEEGVLEKIIIPENTQNIQLGEIIAIIVGEGELIEKPASPDPPAESQKIIHQEKTPKSSLMGPSVKKLLNEFNVKHTDVASSGPKNNLLKGDVLKFIKHHNLEPIKVEPSAKKPAVKSKPSSKEGYVDIPISSTDVESGRQLIQSKITMPHGYMSIDCNMDNTLNYIMNYFKKDDSVSLNEFIIKSVVTALKKVPTLNTVRQNGQLQSSDSINISITDFNNGKYETSFIKNAGGLNVQSISDQRKEHKSSPLQGAFQISNLSSLGITNFIEVISPSDVATLTVSGIQSVFDEGSTVRKMRVTLSFDNYVIGETEAGKFLDTLKNCLENPLTLMC